MSTRGSLAALGAGVLVVVCCAALPVVVGALGGLTAWAVLGWGAGVAAVILVGVIVAVRRRRAPARQGVE